MKKERVRDVEGREGGYESVEWGEGSLYYLWQFQLSNESDVRNKRYSDTCGTACQ